MVGKRVTIAAVGIAGVAAGLFYYAYRSGLFSNLIGSSEGVNGFTVIISSVTGGSVSPTPGMHKYPSSTTIHLSAVPQSGYVFDGWFINGQVISTNLQYDYTVSSAVIITASFRDEDAPQIFPKSIKPLQNAVAEDHWRILKGEKWDTWLNMVSANKIYLESYEKQVGYIQFKIQDENGNGVPNQKIGLYTEPMPDSNQYGYLLLNDEVHFRSTQYPTIQDLIVTTNSLGIATAKVSYWWYEGANSDYRNSVGRFARVHWIQYYFLQGWFGPPIGSGDFTSTGQIVDRFERLQNPCFITRNPIHAYWVDNPNLQVFGDCYVDCIVRLDPSGDIQVDPTRPYTD